jgi:DNA-binding XRE family transcriptional regulator
MTDVITTPGGERLVLVPEAEFARLREADEMAADLIAYQRATARLANGDDELIPIDLVERLLAGENKIRVWREHRGLSSRELAEQAGIAAPFLSQIEAGKRQGTVETLKALAKALGLTIDDLV